MPRGRISLVIPPPGEDTFYRTMADRKSKRNPLRNMNLVAYKLGNVDECFPDGAVQIPLEVREVEQFAGKRKSRAINDLASPTT